MICRSSEAWLAKKRSRRECGCSAYCSAAACASATLVDGLRLGLRRLQRVAGLVYDNSLKLRLSYCVYHDVSMMFCLVAGTWVYGLGGFFSDGTAGLVTRLDKGTWG